MKVLFLDVDGVFNRIGYSDVRVGFMTDVEDAVCSVLGGSVV